MGIFDSLTTAVSGLSAQAYALQNISGNIANSQTTAFKRLDTRFQNMIGDNLATKQISGGVLASSSPTNNVRGDIQNSSTSTFMALNGNGYFIVQKPTGFTGNQPVFSGVNLYTRRGDFQPDQNGYMVNAAGYYLMGLPLDPTTGVPSGSIPVTLQFSNNLIPAQQTSQIQYNANLPSQPITTNTRSGDPTSNLLLPANYVSNPLVGPSTSANITGNLTAPPGLTDALVAGFTAGETMTVTIGANPPTVLTFGPGAAEIDTVAELETALKAAAGANGPATSATVGGQMTLVATGTSNAITLTASDAGILPALLGVSTRTEALPSNGTVYGVDQSRFLGDSLAGGSITCYDGTGTPVDIQFRWTKRSSTQTGGTDTWNLFYQVNSSPGNLEPAWVNAGQDFTFNSVGQLTPPLSNFNLNSVTVNGQALGNVSVVLGSNGLTQFSNTNGTAQVNLLNQNGSAAGQLQSIAVDDQGRIIGTYSNGRTVPLAEVSLATFNGQNALKQLDGGAYQATADSGPPLQNATAKVVGSSLEASNADIADEFSKLIVTQQAYSANTKIITTVNQMAQDLLSVIR
jgi:flagellar hook protein FlgE